MQKGMNYVNCEAFSFTTSSLLSSSYCTDYEMIEIALYACEKWAEGPGSRGEYYQFENFNSSSRIYIIDGNTPRNP